MKTGILPEVRRGDIYYIQKTDATSSEQSGGRPAVIVSSDAGNSTSECVIGVYMTTQEKRPMEVHVEIDTAPRHSTVLCEQTFTASKMRLGNYMGKVSREEMQKIDRAISVALGIKGAAYGMDGLLLESGAFIELKNEKPEGVIRLEAERDIYQKMYMELLGRLR